ncbi:putative asparagine--tRNA ligase [Arabidopsis thaliana]
MLLLTLRSSFDVGTNHRSETPYSIPKSKLTLEYLRDHTYFRARTSMIAAVTRIRHKMCLAAKNKGRTA